MSVDDFCLEDLVNLQQRKKTEWVSQNCGDSIIFTMNFEFANKRISRRMKKTTKEFKS